MGTPHADPATTTRLQERFAELRDHPDAPIRKQYVIEAAEKSIDDVARTARFRITTGAVDRDNDTIAPAGWDISRFMRNPVVLWAHDYSQPPCARALEMTATADGLESTAQFPPKGVYPFADMVFELIKGGFLNATSVGFRPLAYTRDDERGGIDFEQQELLEFSIVPVPANPDALIVARSKGIDVAPLVAWADAVRGQLGAAIAKDASAIGKGVSPKDVSLTKAPEDEAWSAPSLKDLAGDKSWDDLSVGEKRKIAGHFAYAVAMPPATFGDCKLPHHNDRGSIVWRGVAAAAARMNQAGVGDAIGAVKAHLARHYRAFAKPIPWEANASAWADYEKASAGTDDALLPRLLRQHGFTAEADAMRIVLVRAVARTLKMRAIIMRAVAGTLKTVDPALSAKLSALDSHIDQADEIVDAILEDLGIPDDDEMADDANDVTDASRPIGPSQLPQTHVPPTTPLMSGAGRKARRSGNPDVGETLTEPAVVPPPGTANPDQALCPACGAEYDGDVCTACGWQAPQANPGDPNDPHPMNAPNVGGGARSARGAVARCVNCGRLVRTHDVEATCPSCGYPRSTMELDPIRWNRHLSKAFDVAGEPLEPARLECAWVSRYLEAPVQALSVESFVVPSARMGSFLVALNEGLGAWHVDALRNMTESGREVPPEYESIQLNSQITRSFMVDGLRFLDRPSDHAKLVAKLARTWSGLQVTHYVRHEQASVRTAWVQRVQQRARELNYLRGEAFTLGGEFLDRGTLDWPDLFVEPAKEAVLRRSVERLNEQGEDAASRGLLLLGPPGTGKTLAGRIMMRQADATFIWVSARDFYRSGAFGAFTYAFDLAEECAPTVLFFEDVDNWLGPETVDLLKTEMDGVKRRAGVLTVLTTNFPELLPDALIDRPGRFHDLLEMALPTEAVRQRMLTAWAPDAPERTCAETAKQTAGYSGAHLRELVHFADTIRREQGVGFDEALPLALEKLRAQRALVEALRQAPDYRPRRVVRQVVACAMDLVRKRGRVLSAANESRIRQAQEHLGSVLAQLDTQPPAQADEDGDDDKTLRLVDDDDEPAVLRFTDDVGGEPVTVEDLRIALNGAVREAFGTAVREQTQIALARARGRVD